MAKFLRGNELNLEVERLIEEAQESLTLISPYIKLHQRYASALLTQRDNPKLKIVLIFGKNEEDKSRSMRKDDFDFFKQFPNVEIRYEKCLHAKYYSNDSSSILTSMNLYSFSQDNNIEAGVMTTFSKLASIGAHIGDDSFGEDALNYFERVRNEAELLFKKVPVFDKGKLGTGFGKKYLHSETKFDLLTDFFGGDDEDDNKTEASRKTTYTPKPGYAAKPSEASRREEAHKGYCIRTGAEIPFDIERPLCYEAYLQWNKFGNEDYEEMYCHYTGEKSEGETSFRSPILYKNWNEAREKYNL